ncbi:PEGA domain-containing protein [Candidatus Saccharibacteria bacterium]|nr:PEGA domain-containing protein [Candidatus Saccharibacteria bacterium]
MDERERIQQLRRIKVIVTEFFMFVCVILLVVFLSLIVMGYSLNLKRLGGGGEIIERTGLVQISSKPIGATIEIDGGTALLLRTNGSKTVASGEHTFKLIKEGYEGWEKTIDVREGMMYRLNYPRLFPVEIETEKIMKLEGVEVATSTPNMEKMLVLQAGKMYLVNLNETTPGIFSLDVGLGVKIETFEKMAWSGNSERLLAKINGEIAIINVKAPSEFIFLKDILGEIKVKDVEFETEAGDRLVILTEGGDLREVDVRGKKIGEKLKKNVVSFDNNGDSVVYLTKKVKNTESEMDLGDFEGLEEEAELAEESEQEKAERQKEDNYEFEMRAYQIGGDEDYRIAGVEHETAKIATMDYYGDSLFGIADARYLRVYAFEGWPDDDNEAETIFRGEISFEAQELKKHGKGMVFDVEGGAREAIFDVEATKIIELSEEKGIRGWIDEFLRYRVIEGKLEVEDYDGLNQKEIVSGEISGSKGVFISGNGKWVYYFEGDTLMRGKIRV